MDRETIIEQYCIEDDTMFLSEKYYDDAIVGITNSTLARIVYSYDKLVEITERELNLSYEEAVDHVEYNIIGSCAGGEHFPLIITEFEDVR